MGIIGTVLVVLGVAVLGLVAFGIMAIWARSMSDVPLDAPKPAKKKES